MSGSRTLPVATTLTAAAADRPADDTIFALNAEARRRAAAGERVVNATLGALQADDGTLMVMPSVVAALAAVPSRDAAAYAPIAGSPKFLRAVIGDVYSDPGLAAATVAAATPGGTGALYQAITDFLEPGQSLLTPDYYWGPYHTIATHAGRQVATFPMFTAAGAFDVAACGDALQRQVDQQGRALLFLNSPCHNPTGHSLDAREWAAIAGHVQKVARQAPVAFLIDLAYARFAGPGAADWTVHVSELAQHAAVLVAWSASKSFAMYGARVGALLATHADPAERSRLANALSFACRATWSNCNHQGQLAVAELLLDPARRRQADAEREGLRALLAARVEAFVRAAAAAGLRHPRYEGGFFVAVFTDDPERCAAAMREDGVFVVPLVTPHGGAVRVALCSTPVADVPRLVAALARGVAVARRA